MKKQKFIYITLLICAVCFFVLYIDLLSIILLILTVIYPAIMYGIFFFIRKNCKAELDSKTITAAKDSDIEVTIIIKNNSIFPVPNSVVNLSYKNTLDNNKINKMSVFIPIQARNQQAVKFKLSSKYCGRIKIHIDSIYVYDYLKLFRHKIKAEQPDSAVTVLPDCQQLNASVSSDNYENQDSDIFSKIRSGDDPSEVFNIKEYLEGDKINRIHWKLSSKTDHLMVKEYSLPISNNTVIIFDFLYDKDKKDYMTELDTLVETLLSISVFLIQNDAVHTVVWFDCVSNKLINTMISHEDDVYMLIGKILDSGAYTGQAHALINHSHSDFNHTYLHSVYMTSHADAQIIKIFSEVEKEKRKTILKIGNSIIENNGEAEIITIHPGDVKESLSELVI